ncbi:MAG: invasion associated locus B family protein [Pseudomonadota bacterium]
MRIFLTVLCLTLVPSVTLAATKNTAPKQIGKYGDWTAFVMTQNGRKVCYMASFPKKKEGKYTKRGDVYALVTHRPRENSFNVVSLQAGYPFSEGATVIATIDGKQHKLFAEAETAWAPRGSDKPLTTAMSRGANMIVTGTSRRGTKTKDTYSLKGSLQALRAINKACGTR